MGKISTPPEIESHYYSLFQKNEIEYRIEIEVEMRTGIDTVFSTNNQHNRYNTITTIELENRNENWNRVSLSLNK